MNMPYFHFPHCGYSRRQGFCLISLDQIARKKMEKGNLGGQKRDRKRVSKRRSRTLQNAELVHENKWIEEEDKTFKYLPCDRTVLKVRIILQEQLIKAS